MLPRFDHLIFVVDDLAAAAARFAGLGFAITERADREAGPTENRLICFADGSYIELVRFRDPALLRTHRFAPVADGGWADYVLRIDDLTAAHAAITDDGQPTSPIRKVQKTLADGGSWEVWLSHFGRGVGDPAMPMLAEDRTAHNLRVPDTQVVHPNGATGIAGVRIAVDDLAASSARLCAVLSPVPAAGAGGGQRFATAAGWVELLQPAPGTAEAARLQTVGPGIIDVTLAGPRPAIIGNAP
ncbi:MAG: hypothetical protein BGO82_13990 [Devosia sp. 67-54]|uniref:VOC family protein n=1 Tax=unclassified Devosia TaxID=196773 RepID=UPI0009684F9A|nr:MULTISPECIES: VOC family protein [unclassified Devosia]MBN9306731.1 VOC family protein [Devosia sp.]OJX15996.1 MAG: hypothetical protein BGO82_13990 [Devosia sp. 67-54]